MKLIFVGTGSAFTLTNYHSNVVIEKNGKHFLFDAGSDIRFALRDAKLSYKDIDAIYISHLHGDHAGGLEYLAFASFFDPSKKQTIALYGSADILVAGWNSCWRAGLESIQGHIQTLGDYFTPVNYVYPNADFYWENIKMTPIQTVHIMNGFQIVPSYGLLAHDQDTNKKVFFTADTQYCPHQIKDFYNMADLIIQDCETSPYKSGVHAHYDDLKLLDPSIKQKMFLTHYQDNIVSTMCDVPCGIKKEWVDKAIEDQFKCFVEKGMIYNEF